MASIQCLRCYKTIPIRPEMVGQTVLCPSCLDRVFVSDPSSPQAKQSASAGSADLTSPPPLRRTDPLRREEASPWSSSVGLIAGLAAGFALLLLLIGVAIVGFNPSQEARDHAPQAAAPPPPPQAKAKFILPSNPAPSQFPKAPQTDKAQPPQPVSIPSTASPASPSVALRATPASNADAQLQPGGLGGGGLASAGAMTPQSQATSPAWPEIWKLPPATSSAPEVLASVGDAQTTWNIVVKSPAAGVPMRPNLLVEPDREPGAWTINYVSNPLAPTEKQTLARLRRDASYLTFAWTNPPPDPQFCREVTNSLMEITAGAAKEIGQLRGPLQLQPIALNLNTDKQITEAQIDDLPRVDTLRLEILDLIGFSCEAKLRGGLKTLTATSPAAPTPAPLPATKLSPAANVPLGAVPGMGMGMGMGQPLTAPLTAIEFPEIPGLEIRIRFVKAEATGKLAIAIDPVFRENSTTERDLSAAGLLERLEKEAQTPLLAKAQRQLKLDEVSLDSFQAKEKKVNDSEPVKNDPKRYQGWQDTLTKAKTKTAEYERNVNQLKQTIQTHQARLDAVAKLRAFVKSASEKPPLIHYVVYSECGPTDLLLIDARAPTSPSPGP